MENNLKKMISLIVCFSIIVSFEQALLGQAAARTIKVPLIRAITDDQGSSGQAVMSYYTPVGIGTPPVQFNIQFDIGLSDLFVPHYEWSPFKINLHYGKGFQCKHSSSCNRSGNIFTIEYQGCKLTGKPYEDVMTFNSAHLSSMQTNATAAANLTAFSLRQNFLGIADASDARFKNLPIDGFFGLSPQAQSASTISNLVLSMHSARLIDNLQFSFWFNPILDSNQGGELILGGVDELRYAGQIYWHHLTNSAANRWSVSLGYVSVGHNVVSCNGQQCEAILSTGTNEIYGPRSDVEAIHRLLKTSRDKSGLELIDCNATNLPFLTFAIDGIPYAVLPSNFIRKTKLRGKEVCYVAILASDANPRQWLLGTNFLGAYYSIFDLTYRQVGFAGLRSSAVPSGAFVWQLANFVIYSLVLVCVVVVIVLKLDY